MSIDGYVWLTGTLLVSLVIVFGGNYESSQPRPPFEACPATSSTKGCLMPPQQGLPAMLL